MQSSFTNIKIWSLTGYLTIKTQILLLSLLFSLAIFGILLAIILFGQQIVTNKLWVTSNMIFEWQTELLLNYLWIELYGMKEMIELTKHQITIIRKINTFVESSQMRQQSFIFQKPSMCLLEIPQMDRYCFNNTMCCGIFGIQINNVLEEQLKNIMITTSLVNAHRLEFDFTTYSPVYLTFNSQAKYYCISTGFQFPSTYNPFSRPYYLEHIQSIINQTNPEEYFFASPYQMIKDTIRCPITTSLLDLNKQFLGIAAKDIDFNYSQVGKHQSSNITSYILAHDGKVVFTEKYRITGQPIFYIYESQYSGFDLSDFEQIKHKYYGESFECNCSNFKSNDILCLFNSKLNDNVIVQIKNILSSPYILLNLIGMNQIKQQEYDHFELLNSQLDLVVYKYIVTAICITIGIILTGQIITNIILRQLNNMIERMNQQICSKKPSFLNHQSITQNPLDFLNSAEYTSQFYALFYQNSITSNSVTNLTNAFVNIFHHLNKMKKCDECKYQENLGYPQINKPELRNLKFAKMVSKQLENRHVKYQNQNNFYDVIHLISKKNIK